MSVSRNWHENHSIENSVRTCFPTLPLLWTGAGDCISIILFPFTLLERSDRTKTQTLLAEDKAIYRRMNPVAQAVHEVSVSCHGRRQLWNLVDPSPAACLKFRLM